MGLVNFADPGDIKKTVRVFLGSFLAGVLVLLKMPPPIFILLPLHLESLGEGYNMLFR
jgi:hypothetical protein